MEGLSSCHINNFTLYLCTLTEWYFGEILNFVIAFVKTNSKQPLKERYIYLDQRESLRILTDPKIQKTLKSSKLSRQKRVK